MSNIIYLYLKTHNKTGMKYLGKTVQNPFEYKGSGLYWNRHLDKHGDDVTTEILFETTDIEEIKKIGFEYSERWNIVESKKFANLIPEYGTGGDTSMCFTEETKNKIRESLAKTREGIDLSRSEETKKKIGDAKRGQKHSEQSKQKMSESAKKRGFNGYGFSKEHIPWNKGKDGFLSDTIWINDGLNNKRIMKDESIPDGWKQGRSNHHLQKISKSSKGRKNSNETKRKKSESAKIAWKKRKSK